MDAKKKCFVVMGFGEKTDLATGRTLDLDKTYRVIIRQAVEAAGLECIRADDVIHSGLIEKPMYQLLLEADIVIADLSTSNANTLYELGVRHALRPHMTIVMAEKQFKFPFDLRNLMIRPYEHLGKGIDAEEADRMRGELKKAIEQLLANPEVDSPVYEFLPHLREWNVAVAPAEDVRPESAETADVTSTELMERFRTTKARAKTQQDWALVANCLQPLLARRPNDPYLNQQLALATYKSEQPDALAALATAKSILQELNPRSSTDPETLGLWGAVHRRLYELTKGPCQSRRGHPRTRERLLRQKRLLQRHQARARPRPPRLDHPGPRRARRHHPGRANPPPCPRGLRSTPRRQGQGRRGKDRSRRDVLGSRIHARGAGRNRRGAEGERDEARGHRLRARGVDGQNDGEQPRATHGIARQGTARVGSLFGDAPDAVTIVTARPRKARARRRCRSASSSRCRRR
ncbi:MAG TPA: tetratricopeptide repeat-containing protein [Thermoanaerobaculia bacterium]|jgi:hypothetical protein